MGMFFTYGFYFDIWPLSTWPWPFLESNKKWMLPLTSTFKITHKRCVARQLCSMFIWWPYLTWPWPWHLPIMYKAHTYMQPCSSLRKPLSKFYLQLLLVPSRKPIMRRVTILTIDLPVTWLVTFWWRILNFTQNLLVKIFQLPPRPVSQQSLASYAGTQNLPLPTFGWIPQRDAS